MSTIWGQRGAFFFSGFSSSSSNIKETVRAAPEQLRPSAAFPLTRRVYKHARPLPFVPVGRT
ncbi:MAG: hypothetical protein H7Y13_11895 [Sphingobacteriaceae bacterium]|nr:hypothetical protein [Sphingobacteriaceae bacterium]